MPLCHCCGTMHINIVFRVYNQKWIECGFHAQFCAACKITHSIHSLHYNNNNKSNASRNEMGQTTLHTSHTHSQTTKIRVILLFFAVLVLSRARFRFIVRYCCLFYMLFAKVCHTMFEQRIMSVHITNNGNHNKNHRRRTVDRIKNAAYGKQTNLALDQNKKHSYRSCVYVCCVL